MADTAQRSEKPTPKRKRDGRRKGQIARSPDLVGWATLLLASFVLPAMAVSVGGALGTYLELIGDVAAEGELNAATRQTENLLLGVAVGLVPFLLLLMVATAAGLVVQGGVTLTAQPLRPKLERISLKAGFKRLVSTQSLVETAKAVFRLAALVVLLATVMTSSLRELLGGTSRSLAPAAVEIAASLLQVVRLAAIVGVAVGLADYAFQRHKTSKQLRMTKHEVKQESKNTEGDPTIRGRRRSIHADLSRNQMLAAVGDASVVVMNPVHVAVAIRYQAGEVPTVVAKGTDELALRLKERAFDLGVPVVESRALARLLDRTLEVGSEVPAQLYEAVAIVIAFVLQGPPPSLDRVARRVNVPLSVLGSWPEDGSLREDGSARSQRARSGRQENPGRGDEIQAESQQDPDRASGRRTMAR